MEDKSFELTVIAAADDPVSSSREYQDALSPLSAAFRSANVGLRERMFFQDSATASHVVQLGQYFFSSPLPQTVVTAIAAYLVGRSGRKVRLKWGDKEAEAGSIKEVEELLKLANALADSASQQSQDGQKSTPAPPK
ncbi:hypothetical protein [Caulobacter sp. AP07]|uniref:hypothetical protein n=1 Tax=Caulobacter sp. AP07 TaxID=1144304 RepID=UPI0012F8D631|nr:hypothetical protein [Caulobacter sp. AP07]